MRHHGHAERSVAMFATVIILAGVVRLVTGKSGLGWQAVLLGLAMLVVNEWVVWRR